GPGRGGGRARNGGGGSRQSLHRRHFLVLSLMECQTPDRMGGGGGGGPRTRGSPGGGSTGPVSPGSPWPRNSPPRSAAGGGRRTLRGAWRLLEAEGYLDSVANGGVRVPSVELGSPEELYAIRLLLEPPLIRSLVSDLTAAELDEMEASLDGMVRSETRRSD